MAEIALINNAPDSVPDKLTDNAINNVTARQAYARIISQY